MKSSIVVVGLVVVLAGCGSSFDRRQMVRVDPGGRWGSDLAYGRASKDELFKSSPGSPIRAADRESFDGLDYWEPDPGLHFVGPINPYDDPARFQMPTTAGDVRETERFGWISFELDGRRHTLNVYRLLDAADLQTGLLLAFTDATSGQDTYPAGRYVDLDGTADGPYVLDFNRAYNPSCAYGDPTRFACPVAPPENRLPVPVRAGERGFVEP